MIFDDEDEAELKAAYISARIKYPNYDIFQIADYVFKDLRDPEIRGRQAAAIWEKDLDVQEQIRNGRLNGEASDIDSKDDKLRKLQAIYNDENKPLKERLDAIKLHSELKGEVIKAVDKKVTNKNPRREIIFAQRQDD